MAENKEQTFEYRINKSLITYFIFLKLSKLVLYLLSDLIYFLNIFYNYTNLYTVMRAPIKYELCPRIQDTCDKHSEH